MTVIFLLIVAIAAAIGIGVFQANNANYEDSSDRGNSILTSAIGGTAGAAYVPWMLFSGSDSMSSLPIGLIGVLAGVAAGSTALLWAVSRWRTH